MTATYTRFLLTFLLLTVMLGCGPAGAGKVGDENDPAKTTDLTNID